MENTERYDELYRVHWSHILYREKTTGRLLLSILCGTVAQFDVVVELVPWEREAFEKEQFVFIDRLAKEVQADPNGWMGRNVKM